MSNFSRNDIEMSKRSFTLVDFNGFYFAGACYDAYYSNALAGRVKLDSYYKVPASQVIDKMQVNRRISD